MDWLNKLTKAIATTLFLLALSAPVWACQKLDGTAGACNAASTPEIDGSLTIQVIALVGGLALLLKKKR